MTDRDLIDEGRKLLSAATSSDWWHYGDIAHEIYPDSALKSDHEVPPVAGVVERKEDAELIVWMRNNLLAVLDELEAARRSLAAIKVADPDLFDPRGGTSRGAAYETYGSAGHRLREKYLAAIGLVPEDEEDNDE